MRGGWTPLPARLVAALAPAGRVWAGAAGPAADRAAVRAAVRADTPADGRIGRRVAGRADGRTCGDAAGDVPGDVPGDAGGDAAGGGAVPAPAAASVRALVRSLVLSPVLSPARTLAPFPSPVAPVAVASRLPPGFTVALALALAVALARPAAADLPEDSCFVLAPAPGKSGVVALSLRILPLTARDRQNRAPWRYGEIAAVLNPADPAQAAELGGKRLVQGLVCDVSQGQCQAAERRARLAFRMRADGGLELSTDDLPLADYGESELLGNLADPPGRPVSLHLIPAPLAACLPP